MVSINQKWFIATFIGVFVILYIGLSLISPPIACERAPVVAPNPNHPGPTYHSAVCQYSEWSGGHSIYIGSSTRFTSSGNAEGWAYTCAILVIAALIAIVVGHKKK